MDRRTFLAASLAAPLVAAEPRTERYLYAVCPGIRDYLEFGGAGILVFDIDDGHKFVKRIATDASRAAKPRNIKGVVASPATKKLHFTTPETLYCVDLVTAKTEWSKKLPNGCDRLAIAAGRQDALRALVRERHLERRRCCYRGRCSRRSKPRAARTTPSVGLRRQTRCTWPG